MLTRRRYEQRCSFTMPGLGARWRISVTSSNSSSLGIDTTVPSTARMYDYWLGGHDNFAADRAAALKVSEAAPDLPPTGELMVAAPGLGGRCRPKADYPRPSGA